MTKMKIDILDYLGKIDHGVITLISIIYDDEYYEGTFYYNKDNVLALTVDSSLEEKLECVIEEHEDYNEIMLSLIKKVVPVEEIINRLDKIDIERYTKVSKDLNFINSEDPNFSSATFSNV